jgi:hypothetical protein
MAKGICSVEGCERTQCAKGYCELHYRRVRKFGSTDLPLLDRTCSVSGCSRRTVGRGYCRTHYARVRRNGSPGPAALQRHPRERCSVAGCEKQSHGDGLCAKHYKRMSTSGRTDDRTCPYCGVGLGDDNRRRHCPAHQVEHYKAQQARLSIARHGITVERYVEILLSQGSRCAICRRDEPGGQGRWHIDHDHSCCPKPNSCGACVRGLLCSMCNAGIGYLMDDLTILRAAAAYLERSTDDRHSRGASPP